MSKNGEYLRRAIAFAGAVIITVNIVAAPQRARAVAVTASVVASVAAIMTACGVGYWAATQQDAIDYLGGKIDSYLAGLEQVPVSYEDWLGISGTSQLFEVTANGAMSFASGVTNKVFDFVRWFNQEEGVVSGGDDVLVANSAFTVLLDEGMVGSASLVHTGTDTYNLVLDKVGKVTDSHRTIRAVLPAGTAESAYLQINRYNGSDWCSAFGVGFCASGLASTYDGARSYFSGQAVSSATRASSADDAIVLCFNITMWNTNARSITCPLIIRASGATLTDDVVRVSPSAAVAVPDDLTDDTSFDVTPSVPLTEGMTVAQASEAVLDGVASEDGLTSEGESAADPADPVVGWGWLADLLERIREAVEGTQEAVESNHEAVQGMQEAVEGTQQAVEGTQQAVEGMQEAVEGIQHAVQPAQYSAIGSYQLNLTNFFPFCIPWDLFRGLSLLVADPVAPSIDWEVPLPDGSTYTLSLDFSEFDGVAQVARTMELLAFVVALAVATKKLIKW